MRNSSVHLSDRAKGLSSRSARFGPVGSNGFQRPAQSPKLHVQIVDKWFEVKHILFLANDPLIAGREGFSPSLHILRGSLHCVTDQGRA